ncbi:hypothetical protein HC174_03885 [Salinimicrobium sp. CDJ15-81-2]|nr:hypothetical protein [Salinimicrobium nanhaiense]
MALSETLPLKNGKKEQALVFQVCYNVPYKNSAAIASEDFPQENQTQQVHTDF